jgi:hypothetical protein
MVGQVPPFTAGRSPNLLELELCGELAGPRRRQGAVETGLRNLEQRFDSQVLPRPPPVPTPPRSLQIASAPSPSPPVLHLLHLERPQGDRRHPRPRPSAPSLAQAVRGIREVGSLAGDLSLGRKIQLPRRRRPALRKLALRWSARVSTGTDPPPRHDRPRWSP